MSALPPPLAGEGGEGEAPRSEQAASPSPALQPKSDLSDFGRLMMPKSGKPDFGCKRGGEGAGAVLTSLMRLLRKPGAARVGRGDFGDHLVDDRLAERIEVLRH